MPLAAPAAPGGIGPGSTTPTPVPGGGPPPSPGPGTDSIIPDAGVYGAETAAATNAYNLAVANATARRNSLYNQYGLLNDGTVDPNNPYGQYEQMLNSQERKFHADNENSASRGLGSGGLANQLLSQDTNAANADDYGFQQQVAGTASDYQNSLADALGTENSSVSAAYTDALNTALKNMLNAMSSGDYTAPGTGTSTTPPPPKKSKGSKGKATPPRTGRGSGSRHHFRG